MTDIKLLNHFLKKQAISKDGIACYEYTNYSEFYEAALDAYSSAACQDLAGWQTEFIGAGARLKALLISHNKATQINPGQVPTCLISFPTVPME